MYYPDSIHPDSIQVFQEKYLCSAKLEHVSSSLISFSLQHVFSTVSKMSHLANIFGSALAFPLHLVFLTHLKIQKYISKIEYIMYQYSKTRDQPRSCSNLITWKNQKLNTGSPLVTQIRKPKKICIMGKSCYRRSFSK